MIGLAMMVSCCQTCGSSCYAEFFICCNGCKIAAEHKYCMATMPENFDVIWYCELCKQKDCKVPSPSMAGFDGDGSNGNDEQTNSAFKNGSSSQKLQMDVNACSVKKQPTGSYFSSEHPSGIHVDSIQKEGKNGMLLSSKWDDDKTLKRQKRRLRLSVGNGCVPQAVQPFSVLASSRDPQELYSATTLGILVGKMEKSLNPSGGNDEDANASLLHANSFEKSESSLHLCKRHDMDRTFTKRRRLMLLDQEEVDEEFQIDQIDQALPNSTVLVVKPATALPPTKANALTHTGPSDLVVNSLQNTMAALPFQESTPPGTHKSESTMLCQWEQEENYFSATMPVIDCAWRGFFRICGENYGPLRAHLSNHACQRVWACTAALSSVLVAEKLPRLDAWPNSFMTSPPTDDNIALFFFADDERIVSMLDKLLNDFIHKDLMLRVMFDAAELLIFASNLLPECYHRFHGKYYFWGVFKRRQDSQPTLPPNCLAESKDELAQQIQPLKDAVVEDKKEASIREELILTPQPNCQADLKEEIEEHSQRLEHAVIEQERQEASIREHEPIQSARPNCHAKMTEELTEKRELPQNSVIDEKKQEASLREDEPIPTTQPKYQTELEVKLAETTQLQQNAVILDEKQEKQEATTQGEEPISASNNRKISFLLKYLNSPTSPGVPLRCLVDMCRTKLNEELHKTENMVIALEKIVDMEEGEIIEELEEMEHESHIGKQAIANIAGLHKDDGGIGCCLELFPLRQESLAITGRSATNSGIGLELSLGCSFGDVNDGVKHCETKPKSEMHFDCAIIEPLDSDARR